MEPQKTEIGKDSGGIIRAVNRLSRGRIEILKLDAQWHEKPLPGAWFEVKNVKTGELFRMVTGSDGKAVSGELPAAYLGDDGRAVPYDTRYGRSRPQRASVWTRGYGNSGLA